ncbi:MAG: hypothetical protein AB1439_11445 [candidate division FCPU426 bacterium]
MTLPTRQRILLKDYVIPGALLLLLILMVGVRFSFLLEKTREGTTVGNLHHIRQALLLYYQDHNGVHPRELSPQSPFGRYLSGLPAVATLHPRAGAASPAGGEVTYGTDSPRGFGRGWYYNYETGQIYINSIGQDTRGVAYSAY